MSYSSVKILEQWDRAAEAFEFPALDDGHSALVDMRLHAYRDDARWALVIEQLSYTVSGGALMDILHVFGNCIDGQAGPSTGDFIARTDDMDLIADDGVDAVDVLRALVPAHRHLFLASEDELRRRIPADLPEVLMLDEWHHPDILGGELASETDTFYQLAEVLAGGDAARYRPADANTHWSNWRRGGKPAPDDGSTWSSF